jgi:transketolase
VIASRHHPSRCLSRQAMPTLDRTIRPAAGVAKGAYILADSGGTPR